MVMLLGIENMSSSKQKGSQRGKAKEKKEIKVVYISNPMRVEASASEFKGIVQELTGQDSDLAKFAGSSPEKVAGGDLRREKQPQEAPESYDEIFSKDGLVDLSGYMASGPFYLPEREGNNEK